MDVRNSTAVTTSPVAATTPRAGTVTAHNLISDEKPPVETKVTLSDESLRMYQLASDPGDWPTPPTEENKKP